jgi:hypothetical protein
MVSDWFSAPSFRLIFANFHSSQAVMYSDAEEFKKGTDT